MLAFFQNSYAEILILGVKGANSIYKDSAPNDPPPNTITLGVMISAYKFWLPKEHPYKKK